MLHKVNISYYGGTSAIVPLPLNVFIKMIEESHAANYAPQPKHIQQFFEYSNKLANTSTDETEWYEGMKLKALNWLK